VVKRTPKYIEFMRPTDDGSMLNYTLRDKIAHADPDSTENR